MPIQDIDLFHGVVLAKLMRKRPDSVSLVEFDAKTSSSAYRINLADCYLYVKHSKTPDPREPENQFVWHFSFSPRHLNEIKDLKKNAVVYTILICGKSDLNDDTAMSVCFLEPDEMEKCIDIYSTSQQSIHVKVIGRGKLRVWGTKNGVKNLLHINKSAFDRWEVPGR